MQEEMVPGDYTTLVDLKIRSQMDTTVITNQVGVYSRGLPITVYQVYPEKDGIVWGRVSSNTGAGKARYVGLRVTNNLKVQLEKAFEPESNGNGLAIALRSLTTAITLLTDAVRELAGK